jgi:hypothetical protein
VLALPVAWDDPDVDWTAFDLAIVRSTWDYASRRAEFLSWAARVPRLENRCLLLEWNTDKRYLTELDAHGVAVIPTTWVRPDDDWQPPAPAGELEFCVIKPAVSLCALDTGRYDLADTHERALAVDHVRRLQAAGCTAMVQPYLTRIESAGETSLVFFAGRFSHAVRKGAVLDGPARWASRLRFPSRHLAHSQSPAAPSADRLQRMV